MRDLRAGLYRHYLGGVVQVLCEAQDCQTGLIYVVCIKMGDMTLPDEITGSRVRLREITNFNQFVKHKGKRVRRFEYIKEKNENRRKATWPQK